MQDLAWKVGGAQGEGIDSTGDVVISTLNRLGHFTFAYRSFMSLIKGGHTSYKIRVADEPVYYQGDGLDILIAFDQETIDADAHELRPGGLVIADDGKWQPELPQQRNLHLLRVPMSQMARDVAKNVVMKNMVAVGVSAAVMDMTPDPFFRQIEERFGKKGTDVVALNQDLIRRGFEFARQEAGHLPTRRLPAAADRGHYLLSGNEAMGLGALLAGCRFLAAYPITPATEILYWLLANLPRYGGKIIQAEDEIAACNMAIGAGFAGVRAMTTTSSPGFSLMAEAIGLAAIAEVPLVVVDVQRAGPATGLPTKTEQSNLYAQLWNSHGEGPRIVLAPTTIAELCTYGAEAFNLAERYQCPVIVSSDLFLGSSRQGLPRLELDRVRIDRGKLRTAPDLSPDDPNTAVPGVAAPGDPAATGTTAYATRVEYQRYADTRDGVSPRSIPGVAGCEYTALSNEHDDRGRIEIEDPETRVRQMRKRFRKLDAARVDLEARGVIYEGPETPDLLIVGVGSTRAQIAEACRHLRAAGEPEAQGRGGAARPDEPAGVGHLQLRLLQPFPDGAVRPYLATCRRALVVDNNFTAQLQGLIAQHCGFHQKLVSCTKYDGDPFTVREIIQAARDALGAPAQTAGVR